MFTPWTKNLHKQHVITQTTPKYLTLVANQILSITHTIENQKLNVKHLQLNCSTKTISQTYGDSKTSSPTTYESKPKTQKTKTFT